METKTVARKKFIIENTTFERQRSQLSTTSSRCEELETSISHKSQVCSAQYSQCMKLMAAEECPGKKLRKNKYGLRVDSDVVAEFFGVGGAMYRRETNIMNSRKKIKQK